VINVPESVNDSPQNSKSIRGADHPVRPDTSESLLQINGRFLKIAGLRDEELVEGKNLLEPIALIEALQQTRQLADILTFPQRSAKPNREFDYPFEWDNEAIISISTFQAWWDQLPQETRRNVRRAEKKGIVVRSVEFDDELVRGIKEIYDESPARQGRSFAHYGKPFEVIKAECSTYLERSTFLGAYLGSELVGFLKMVRVDSSGSILHILSKLAHHDKRPTNALICKAVETCVNNGFSELVYCKYSYGKGDQDPLSAFKRHNGFIRTDFPRYYVPLTKKGRLAIALNCHLGMKNLVPSPILALLRRTRTWYYVSFRKQLGG
jgi:hypothetical protein